MPEVVLTDEQQAAIRVEGSAIVRAGAGVGKTRVLAERFLHLLRPGDDPPRVGEILAITFTEKAATEMRRTIRERLADMVRTTAGEARGHWERVRRELLGAQISTIHAFCARIVRENPLEAGMDPHAVVLDEHTSRSYVEAVVGEALADRVRAEDAAARDLIRRSGLRDLGRREGAVALCVRLLATQARLGRDATWLEEAARHQRTGAPALEVALRDAARRLIDTVEERLGEQRAGKTIELLRERWPPWVAWLHALSGATPIAEFRRLEELRGLLATARLAGAVDAELALRSGRLAGRLVEQYGALRALDGTEAMAGLLGALAETLRRRKRADAVLTFDDLIAEARALLIEHAEVRDRYARRFRAILVDEFQDTDVVQAELIERLAGDGVPLFVVGDEKQSIYRFRGADVTVFQRTCDRLGRVLPLGRNFRSRPAILEFVNALAASTLRPPSDAVDPQAWTGFGPAHRLVPDRTAAGSEPAVRLLSFVAEQRTRTLSASAARELEARAVAGLLRALSEHGDPPVRYGDVAILFSALTEVKAYEYALRRCQVPYYVVKGRGFFQCQEIRDVTSMLAAVADPDDGIALAATLRSPWFAVDDDTLLRLGAGARPGDSLGRRLRDAELGADLGEAAPRLRRAREVLRRLRRLAGRATVPEVLEAALAGTDFEAVCLTQFQGAQKVANVRKLIELARGGLGGAFGSLGDFVRRLRRLEASETREAEAPLVGEQGDVVRLMTIHQAKGLEFPVVVLVDLGRMIERDWSAIVLDAEHGVIVAPPDGPAMRPLRHALLEEHRRREGERSYAEHARLFYVGCTRARDLLVLSEGKGDLAYLQEGRGDPRRWCHQVWSLVGRERVVAAAGAAEPRSRLTIPDGGEILLERAELYLDRETGARGGEAGPVTAPSTSEEHAAVARVLDFQPPRPTEVLLTPTALADFRRCPRQHWYRHVLGLPEPGSGGRSARRIGTAAHGVLETLDVATADPDEIGAAVERRPEALLLSRRDRASLAEDLSAAGRRLRADVDAGLELVGREVPFVLALTSVTPRVVLEGRIDLLAKRGETWVVRDYKYARSTPGAVESNALQLGAYQLAVVQSGAARVAAELVFLRGGVTVRALPAFDSAAEEMALGRAGVALAEARASGGVGAFPRGPESAVACTRLGCGYVRRCWRVAPARVIRRAPAPGTGGDGS